MRDRTLSRRGGVRFALYVDIIQVRNFFHVVAEGNLPAEWMGCETGDPANDPITFRFYWLPFSQGHVLTAGQGALLGCLLD
jgi:hypothetical protein